MSKDKLVTLVVESERENPSGKLVQKLDGLGWAQTYTEHVQEVDPGVFNYHLHMQGPLRTYEQARDALEYSGYDILHYQD